MGHTAEIWQDPVFLKMLLGGIRWATGRVDADIRPDIDQVTPQASEIPQRAAQVYRVGPAAAQPAFPELQSAFPGDHGPPQSSTLAAAAKRILFFSKSAGYEHPIAYREAANCCSWNAKCCEFGPENNMDFVFSKDGTFFTPENLAKFDAIVFYTSGDLTNQPRNGLGDNYPLMTPPGKEALLQAIRKGKGFIGVHVPSIRSASLA